MRKGNILKISFLVTAIGLLVLMITCDSIIKQMAKSKTFTKLQDLPANKVGLIPGTAKYLDGGELNPYYQNRIAAALALLHTNKIKYIIASGDNSRAEYNEPLQMRNDLIEAGIDSAIIFLDYAGLRTFDSIVRAKEIFGQHSITIISQPFQNERGIYIAHFEGINAIGFNAKDVNGGLGFRIAVREKFARVKLFIDYLFNTRPKYAGAKVFIPIIE